MELNRTELMDLIVWLTSGDTGMSSKWMARVCAGVSGGSGNDDDDDDRGAYPYDPSDFGRCYRFLRAVPSARKNMAKLKDSGPVWAGYIDHWDEMERLYEEELPSGKASKLYAMMKSIREAGEKQAAIKEAGK